jgi:signal transduction histidine kinase
LELRWRAGDATVIGEAAALEQAVDNLIVNAIEHGGPEIVVEGRRRAESLVISVADSGDRSRSRPGEGGSARPVAAPLSRDGRRRRGHGLALVRRFAAAQGGRFVLRQADGESVATLELPLAGAFASDPAA